MSKPDCELSRMVFAVAVLSLLRSVWTIFMDKLLTVRKYFREDSSAMAWVFCLTDTPWLCAAK